MEIKKRFREVLGFTLVYVRLSNRRVNFIEYPTRHYISATAEFTYLIVSAFCVNWNLIIPIY